MWDEFTHPCFPKCLFLKILPAHFQKSIFICSPTTIYLLHILICCLIFLLFYSDLYVRFLYYHKNELEPTLKTNKSWTESSPVSYDRISILSFLRFFFFLSSPFSFSFFIVFLPLLLHSLLFVVNHTYLENYILRLFYDYHDYSDNNSNNCRLYSSPPNPFILIYFRVCSNISFEKIIRVGTFSKFLNMRMSFLPPNMNDCLAGHRFEYKSIVILTL